MSKADEEYQKIIDNPETKKIAETDNSDLVITEEELQELADIADTTPVVYEAEETLPVVPEQKTNSEELNDDFQHARKKLYDAIDVASNSLKELSLIAKSSKHPRAYEVVALLAKTITDSNKVLLNLHREQQKVQNENLIPDEEGEAKQQTNINTQNNLFVGTTTNLDELLDRLEKKKDAKD